MKPKFSPQAWVTFKFENSQAFGQIIGGYYEADKDEWLYTVSHKAGQDTANVLSSDIVLVLKNDSWDEV